MTVAARLAELGISLPEPAKAVANYVPFVQTGNLVHISGQLSNDASGGLKGTVGADVSQEDRPSRRPPVRRQPAGPDLAPPWTATSSASCASSNWAASSRPPATSTAIPAVINGCSDLMVEVFGDKGRHARSAVGVYKLPLGFAVEVDAIVEVR